MTNKQHYINHWVLVGAFAALIFLPFFSLITSEKDFTVKTSSLENATKSINIFVSKEFGFRKTFIQTSNRIHVAMDVSPSKRAVLGKDGWLFLNQRSMNAQFAGKLPYRKGELQKHFQFLSERQAWLEERGVAYVAVMAPDKQSIYPEYLPDSIRKVGPSRSDVFRREIKNTPINFVDVFPVLHEAKSGQLPPYYSTDSHWNCYGSYLASQEISKKLKALHVPVNDGWKIGFTGPFSAKGRDIAQNILGIPDSFTEQNAVTCSFHNPSSFLYERMKDGFQTTDRKYVASAQQTWKVTKQAVNNGNLRKAVVIRDSFGIPLLSTMSESFDETVYFSNSLPFPKAFIEEYMPDVVIHEFAERALLRK